MEQEEKIKAYKGFDKNLRCRGYQYKIGKDYECKGRITCCWNGFHACENPMEVLEYYGPTNSRYCVVKQSGEIDSNNASNSSKKASSKISITMEISLKDIIKAGKKFILDRVIWNEVKPYTGKHSAITNTRDRPVVANTEDCSVATNIVYDSASVNIGSYSMATNTANRSAAINIGYCSIANNIGAQSAALSINNYSAAFNIGYCSIAVSVGYGSVAISEGQNSTAVNTGNQSVAANEGYNSTAVNVGDYSAASVKEEKSIAITTGFQGKAKGSLNCWIIIAERDPNDNILDIKVAKVDGEKIKADTYYRLVDGEFVEAE